jgi:hypothetical protein
MFMAVATAQDGSLLSGPRSFHISRRTAEWAPSTSHTDIRNANADERLSGAARLKTFVDYAPAAIAM